MLSLGRINGDPMPRIWESDLAKYVRSGERARTIDHAGTLLNSTMKIGPLSNTNYLNTYIFLMPIAWHAALTKMRLRVDGATMGPILVGVHGIDSDGRYEHNPSLVAVHAITGNTTANTIKTSLSPENWGLSMYEMAMEADPKGFAPFMHDKYAMLSFGGHSANFPQNLRIELKIQYVEPSPSEIRKNRFTLEGV